jgi:hypothetical protein
LNAQANSPRNSPRNSFDEADIDGGEREEREKKLAKKVGRIEKQMAAQEKHLEQLRAQNEKILEILSQMSV